MRSARRRLLSIILSGAVSMAPMLIDSATAVEVQTHSATNKKLASQNSASTKTPDQRTSGFPAGHRDHPSEDCFILGARSFSIPFTVEDSASGPVEVHLFAKPALGGSGQNSEPNWKWITAKPSLGGIRQQFTFTADSDGEYWFATWTTPATSQPLTKPSSEELKLREITPQRKIFVDTTGPSVKLDADCSAEGKVQVFASVEDASPIEKVEMRYVSDQMNQWHPLDQQATADKSLATGQPFTFDVEGDWQQLSVQLVATDKAGNQTIQDTRVERPRIAEMPGPRYADASLSAISPYRSPAAPRLFDQSRSYASPPLNRPNSMHPGPMHPGPMQPGPMQNRPMPQRPGHGYATPTPFGTYRGASTPSHSTPPTPTDAYQGLFSSDNDPVGQLKSGVPETILPPPATPDQIGRSGTAAKRLDLGGDVNSGYPTLPTPSQSMKLNPARPIPTEPLHLGQSRPETLPAPPAQRDASNVPAPKFKPSVEKMQAAERAEVLRKHRSKSLTEAMRPLSEESMVPKRETTPEGSTPRTTARRPSYPKPYASRVPIRYSDTERFSLDYVLEAVGARGVDAIELYGSLDEGKTWKLWGRDPDKASPFDIEVRDEGVFAYQIVVVSSAGLASPRPLSGDLPDMVVVVDKQDPEIRIRGARYGEGDRTGALVIQYECHDPNLTKRPITLSFSESVKGPWTTIAGGLRNDGDYVWPADPGLPRAFYLRIDAKDQAGNVGTYILDKAIDAQGLAPRARIRGFQTREGAS